MKLLEDNIGEKLDDLGDDQDFLDVTLKTWSVKEKLISWNSLKLKPSTLQKTLLGEWKDSHIQGEKSCKTHMIKDYYPKNVKST